MRRATQQRLRDGSSPRFVGALAFVLVLVAAGCERAQTGYYGTTEPRHGPEEMWTNLGAEPEWIDPGKCSDSAGGTILFNLFAGLTQTHPKTMRPMPDIATGWDISADGRTYIFHLRESSWSDGKPLTAYDFEWSWKRVLDRATASKYASFLYPLEYAEAFNRGGLVLEGVPATATEADVRAALAGIEIERIDLDPARGRATLFVAGAEGDAAAIEKARVALAGRSVAGSALRARVADASLVGVRAIDAHTLEARLIDPLPYFIDLTSYYTLMPVPRHVLERLQREGKNPDLWTRPEYIVSNGAFVLDEWKFRQHMVLRKNPRYWDARQVKLERVRFLMVDSYNTTLNLYEAGEIDYIGQSSLPAEFLDHLARYKDYQSEPFLAVYFLWVNTKAEPLQDKRVRQALSLAIDRKSLVDYVLRGGQIPSADLVPDGVAGYEGLKSPLFDPQRARALLQQAGYGPGRPLPPVTFLYNTSEGHKQIAQALQQMWSKNLGVQVEIENQEWKVYLKSLQAHDFQMARLGWVGDYADPFTFLELATQSNGNNHSNWSSPEYERLLRRANATRGSAARLALLREAERIVADERPMIPLYVYTRSELIKPYVMGEFLNYQHRELYKWMWIDPRWYGGKVPERLPNTPPPMVQPQIGVAP